MELKNDEPSIKLINHNLKNFKNSSAFPKVLTPLKISHPNLLSLQQYTKMTSQSIKFEAHMPALLHRTYL